MRRAATRLGLGLSLALVFAPATALGLEGSDTAPLAKSRVIDRTISCPIVLQAGVRELHIVSRAGVRDQGSPSKWLALPHVSLYGGAPEVSVGMSAGHPAPTPVRDSRKLTLWIDNDVCRPASARVALSSKGLGGGPASQLEERFECVVPRRILVRIRAELRSPASLQLGEFTGVPLKAGFLAARSESGKPLVYAEVFESGNARLFLAGNCVRD